MNKAGELQWPIRLSFARYVAGLPDGRATLGDGARAVADGGIGFPLIGMDAGQGLQSTRLRFSGSILFQGHFGALSVRIAEPWLEFDGGTGNLSIAEEGAARRLIATYQIRSDEETDAQIWTCTAVALTQDGAALFNHVYPVGSLLDPCVARRYRR